MNVTRRPAAGLATESFDRETQELLDAIEVELPEFGDVDLDVAFGTPLEMHELWATPQELARFEAGAGLKDQAERVQELWANFLARRCAALDIVAVDPSVTALVRERLVDVLLPYAVQLRITLPTVTPVPVAA